MPRRFPSELVAIAICGLLALAAPEEGRCEERLVIGSWTVGLEGCEARVTLTAPSGRTAVCGGDSDFCFIPNVDMLCNWPPQVAGDCAHTKFTVRSPLGGSWIFEATAGEGAQISLWTAVDGRAQSAPRGFFSGTTRWRVTLRGTRSDSSD